MNNGYHILGHYSPSIINLKVDVCLGQDHLENAFVYITNFAAVLLKHANISWTYRLAKAKEILCDKKKRKQYDSWRRSGLDISFDLWLKTEQTNHVSMHWAPVPKKKKMIESCESSVGKWL